MPLGAHLLNREATIYRSQGEVRLASGGWRDAPPTIVGAAPVRVHPAGAREATIGGVHGAVVTHTVYASSGADIRRGDTLEVLTPERMLLQVILVQRPSDYAHHMTALAVEVQRGA